MSSGPAASRIRPSDAKPVCRSAGAIAVHERGPFEPRNRQLSSSSPRAGEERVIPGSNVVHWQAEMGARRAARGRLGILGRITCAGLATGPGEGEAMLALIVSVRIKPDKRQRFLEAIEDDAICSE